MKKIIQILAIGSLSLLAACNHTDDQFYNTVYIEAPNLVSIEGNNFYFRNDSLVFTISFPNLLQGETDELPTNLYETTKSPYFLLAYSLEKWNNKEWIVYKNGINTSEVPIVLNGAFYKGREAIYLPEVGSYRLRFDAGFKPEQIGVISKNNNPNPTVNISTTVVDYKNIYNFVVLH
ncbi:hypothetical protein K5I29_03900 [Flavobacterium agricola]|uniref:DUF1735 domain-containing protein n=1 Tax=Flavobacterium agricola TaxID=2870839 RepID=A0ABY6M0U6_9FLAO|nr:hypothetical protein [Flavobacterium agricola]UYW02056.1 hypothetical protein K5I29_03900 [Flavobacterium agricola]